MLILWKAALYIGLLSVLAGPVGSLILWRRMTFLGESLAHASLMGFILQYMTQWPIAWCMLIITVFYCSLIEFFQQKGLERSDILPLLAYGFMGLSLLVIEKFIAKPSLMNRIILGDVLLVSWSDCLMIGVIVAAVLVIFKVYYRGFILYLYSAELAFLHRPQIIGLSFLMNILIGLSVTMAVQGAGMLLAMALLTIPAITAYPWSRTPWSMIVLSTFFAFTGSLLGFHLSLKLDASVGSCIIVLLLGLYLCSQFTRFLLSYIKILA
jgi:zinc transport system permease protein